MRASTTVPTPPQRLSGISLVISMTSKERLSVFASMAGSHLARARDTRRVDSRLNGDGFSATKRSGAGPPALPSDPVRIQMAEQRERAALDRPVLRLLPAAIRRAPGEEHRGQAFAEIGIAVFDPEVLDREDPIDVRLETPEVDPDLARQNVTLARVPDDEWRDDEQRSLDPKDWRSRRDILSPALLDAGRCSAGNSHTAGGADGLRI